MPREKIGDDLMQVRFADGTFARIDEVSGNRSEFIRGAVDVALGGVPASANVVSEKIPVDFLEADKAALLALLSERRLGSRDAARRLGLPGRRYDNAERALLASGAILSVSGVLAVWGE